MLDGPLGKTKYYAICTEFQESESHISIPLYGFSMHQILKMKQSTWTLLKNNKCKVARLSERDRDIFVGC